MRRTSRFVRIALSWLLLVWANYLIAAPAVRSQPTAPSRPASSPVRAADRHAGAARTYLQWVSDLADANMEGRGAGTAGLAKARDYIEERFKAAGLKPPFGQSYAQGVDIPFGMKAERQELAVLDPNGKQVASGEPGGTFNALGFGSGSFKGPAAFVGYGIVRKEDSYDSYGGAGKDALKGKIAVAYRYEPQDKDGKGLWARKGETWSTSAALVFKAQWAAQHGAEALLIVNPPSQDTGSLSSTSQTAFGGLRIPVMHVSSKLFRQMLLASGAKDADADARRLQEQADAGKGGVQELRGVVLRGSVRLQPIMEKVHNVAGLLPGKGDLAGQYVIVGAHYDHLGYIEQGSGADRKRVVYPGADDNASGTAGVMMLANWFAARAAEKDAPASRRTLLFVAFAGEERGLCGSAYMAGHLDELGIKPQQVAAMINLDMVGRPRDDRVTVFGVDSGEGLRDMLTQAAEAANVKLWPIATSSPTSDHAAFASAKIPALFFFAGLHLDMHTTKDTADKINAPGAVKVLTMAEALIARLWVEPKAPAFVAPKPGATSRSTAFMGIVPDMAADAEGCKIQEVSPNSPAAGAGLKPGDDIVQWNDAKIESAAALFQALAAGKPGDKVALKVRREGQTVTVEVTLGRR